MNDSPLTDAQIKALQQDLKEFVKKIQQKPLITETFSVNKHLIEKSIVDKRKEWETK